MIDRTLALRLVAVTLVLYGVCTASNAVAMLPALSSPLLLTGLILQVICSLVAAVGAWRGDRWTGNAIVLLCLLVVATWLVKAFVIGIVSYLYSLLVA